MIDVEPLIVSELEQMLPLPPGDRADWEDVFRRAGVAPPRRDEETRRGRFTRRRLVAAVVVALALAVPALAFSGVFSSLFGFSNHGTPVKHKSLRTLHGLHVTGARPDTLVQLAYREGIGVYAAVRKSGLSRITPSNRRFYSHLCFYYGPSAAESSGGCGKPRGTSLSADFPSPSDPVWDMSSGFYYPIEAKVPAIKTLVGVAADGVHSVQLLALSDCHPVVTVPVIDNVYIAAKPPVTAESYIVARDARGNVLWDTAVAPGMKLPSCGLH